MVQKESPPHWSESFNALEVKQSLEGRITKNLLGSFIQQYRQLMDIARIQKMGGTWINWGIYDLLNNLKHKKRQTYKWQYWTQTL